jgi:hypothetical protein
MAPPKGHPRYGGRTAGVPNKAVRLRHEARQQAIIDAGLSAEVVEQISPLQVMLICMHRALAAGNIQLAMACAASAAPYCHARLSQSEVRVSGTIMLSDQDLQAEIASLEARMRMVEAAD